MLCISEVTLGQTARILKMLRIIEICYKDIHVDNERILSMPHSILGIYPPLETMQQV